jgi:hypothetical protein
MSNYLLDRPTPPLIGERWDVKTGGVDNTPKKTKV